jgi:hypothetical protein
LRISREPIATTNSEPTNKKQIRLHLPNVAREADRHRIYDRSVASIVNAVLKDFRVLQKAINPK